jgi:alkylhydroperoxidase/carboxymuconolactone decarboxylase family protein YurZ
MADIRKARQDVLDTILGPAGKATQAARKAAFANADVAAPVRALVEKVAKHAYKIVDEDIAAAKAQGVTEDELFELVVCAAVGQASRQYDGALAALAAATES